MATFVLLHSGWCGGWIWKDVAQHLRTKGHDVYSPSLTGHGERVHLSSPEVRLETQIQDICGVLQYEDLHDVILIGHSGSMIAVAGAADREAARIARVVYFDTVIPKNGKSWVDLCIPSSVEAWLSLANREGNGWYMPTSAMPIPNPRFTNQLVKPITDPVVIDNPMAAAIPRSFIYCTDKEPGWFYGHDAAIKQAAAEARSLGWDYYELPTGHAAMFTMPDKVAELFVRIAERTMR
jgi:pimeloyl-ACP methyl ester carboxylesterase